MRSIFIITVTAITVLSSCGNSGETPAANAENVPVATSAEAIFTSKCSVCHNFDTDKIGPALSGVSARWNNDTARLKRFIKNSKELINSGDTYAAALFQKWHNTEMPSNPDMTEEELNALVEYLK